MERDNHLGKVRDNSYNKEQYYDERYDQTREEICEDCEYGIQIENCRECLFNTLCNGETRDRQTYKRA